MTGIISSFIAQGYSAMEGTLIGAYIHGYCGEKLSENMFSVNASHVLTYLPYGMKQIENL